MKNIFFLLNIITIWVCFSEAWNPPRDECPITYAPCTSIFKNINSVISTDAANVYSHLRNGSYSEAANILLRRTYDQIQKIQDDYERHVGEKLTVVNEFPNGHLKKLIHGLFKRLSNFVENDLKELHKSVYKNNVEEYLDTIGVLSHNGLFSIYITYETRESNRNKGYYLGHFADELRDFLDSIGRRKKPQVTNETQVKSNFNEDMIWLKNSVTKKGVDPVLLSQTIIKYDDLNLRALYKLYEKENHHTYLEHLTTSNLMPKKDPLLRRAVIAMYKITDNRLEYFAERLYDSLVEKNYRTVNRIIITRREIDLVDIKNTLERIYGNLAEIIKREITDPKDADYKMTLLGLFEENTN